MSALPTDEDTQFEQAAALLADASNLLFVTGAGISADSGLPTYRGVSGLYEDEDAEDGLPIEVCLSGQVFRSQPALTWKHIRHIEAACRGAEPNAGHLAIATLERRLERVWVLTQNVDGLHAAAGSRNVIAIHGDVHELRCTACAWRAHVDDYSQLDPALPRCPSCAAVIRPDVILFGEMLPMAALRTLERELERGFDAVVTIGTTAVFPYIAAPVQQAKFAGRPTIEINPANSEVSALVDLHLRIGAAEAMTGILAALERRWAET
ncbi:NAD-dependent deacylase [Pseudenhygromyxa sp. WMMC2535]|uniref:NAD-dependent deacylase n=1 Tax=Pseudenhygromyxa sp. WMMC2535 TaxID=2712867 RepID=UPI0015569322|nr:NAD-dependent deacylase [Pseudenhygromyxa sp. WMMC2535]NVB41217.1 NAD-dependent deacylase [Pseudenhygromyxa sp. WMMC2535]